MIDMIAVCGSDCSGKTTLINRLRESLNWQVVKGSSFELSQCSNEELYQKFDGMTHYEEVVFDRFIYCNAVYAPLYKDFAMLTDEQRREIERKISNKAIIIYLEADMETLIERMNTRGDDYVTVDKLSAIKKGYELAMSKVENVEVLRFNTTQQTTDSIVEAILEKLE